MFNFGKQILEDNNPFFTILILQGTIDHLVVLGEVVVAGPKSLFVFASGVSPKKNSKALQIFPSIC